MSEEGEPREAKKWLNAGSFLTENEQRHLRGKEVEYESQVRYRIRYKTLGALKDLFMVGMHLSNTDAKKLFEGAGSATTEGTTREAAVRESYVLPGREGDLSAIVALASRGYKENGIEPEEFLEKVVAPGMRKGIGDTLNIHPSRVGVNIQTDIMIYDNLSEIADRLEEKGAESVTEKEAGLLYRNDKITLEEYTDVLEKINQ